MLHSHLCRGKGGWLEGLRPPPPRSPALHAGPTNLCVQREEPLLFLGKRGFCALTSTVAMVGGCSQRT